MIKNKKDRQTNLNYHIQSIFINQIMSIIELDLTKLIVSKNNVRKDLTSNNDEESTIANLADDIKQNGLINPICVRPMNDGKYEIYAGQRRFLAASHLKWKKITCSVNNISNTKSKLLSLSENLHRSDMTIKDKISAIKQLYTCKLKDIDKYMQIINKEEPNISSKNKIDVIIKTKIIDEIAKMTSLRSPTIAKYLNISMKLNEELTEKLDVKDERLSLGFAEKLINVDKEHQVILYDETKELSNKEKLKFLATPVNNNLNIIEEMNSRNCTQHQLKRYVDKFKIESLKVTTILECGTLQRSTGEKIIIPEDLRDIAFDKIKEIIEKKNSEANNISETKKPKVKYPKIITDYYANYIPGSNLTSIVKKIATRKYYSFIKINCFSNKLFKPIIEKININNEHIINLHKIQPSHCGVFFDYLFRHLISSLSKQKFYDSRALYMSSICKPKIIKYEKIEYDRSKCLSIVEDLNKNTIDIIPEIYIVSLSHNESFAGSLNISIVIRQLMHIINNLEQFKNIVKEYSKYFGDIINISSTIPLLNPNVGTSELRADCDLIIGDTLIDIKCCSKDNEIYEKLQLFGYVSLFNKNCSDKRTLKYVSILNPIQNIYKKYLIKGMTGFDKYYFFLHGIQ